MNRTTYNDERPRTRTISLRLLVWVAAGIALGAGNAAAQARVTSLDGSLVAGETSLP